jgi:hypothetical protein
MKHDIVFNTKDDLITWMDENFPDARVTHVNADGALYVASGCFIEINGLHLKIELTLIEGA